MSLTWHIVKKDLRQLWPWLALLIATILARYALGWHVEHHERPGPILFARSATAEFILLGSQLLIGCLFTAQLIHADTTNSDRAFWLTRPISGLKIVGAKIFALLFILGLLPLLAVLSWWWLHDFRASEIAAALPDFVARQAALIACSFAVALFTRTLGGFLVTSIATALVLWLQIAIYTRLVPRVPATLAVTQAILCFAIVLLTISGCTFLKYHCRKISLPRMLVISAALVCSAITAWWPIDLITPFRDEPVEPAAAAPIDLQLALAISPYSQSALVDFKFTNIPDDHRVEVRSLKIRLQAGDVTTKVPYSSLGFSPVYDAVAQNPVNTRLGPARFTYRTLLPSTPEPATAFKVTARTNLRREETVADIPLAIGAITHDGPYTTRITFAHTTAPPFRTIDVLCTFPARQAPAGGIAEAHTGGALSDGIISPVPARRTRRLFVIGSHREQPVDAMVREDSLQIDDVRYVLENFHYKLDPDGDHDRLVHVIYPLLGGFERTQTLPMPATP